MIDIALKVSREALNEIRDAKKALRENADGEQVIDMLCGAGARLHLVIAHLEEECSPEIRGGRKDLGDLASVLTL